jgi:hypothetical protein
VKNNDPELDESDRCDAAAVVTVEMGLVVELVAEEVVLVGVVVVPPIEDCVVEVTVPPVEAEEAVEVALVVADEALELLAAEVDDTEDGDETEDGDVEIVKILADVTVACCEAVEMGGVVVNSF